MPSQARMRNSLAGVSCRILTSGTANTTCAAPTYSANDLSWGIYDYGVYIGGVDCLVVSPRVRGAARLALSVLVFLSDFPELALSC